MCGIYGYVGRKNAVKMAIEGLKKLEYRGYDSAGIAGLKNGKLLFCKELGKIEVLENAVKEQGLEIDTAISQTRWATHGKPSKTNAHPHLDSMHSVAIVHNGIIENHESLRKNLKEKGVTFASETDSEVIAHLIASLYKGHLLEAVKLTIPLLKGSFAIALIHRDHPDQMIAFANQCPLVVGLGENETFLSSDSHSFLNHTQKVIYLSNGEIAVLKADKVEIYDGQKGGELLEKQSQTLTAAAKAVSKGDFDHYTLKEIYEQPQVIRSALLSRFLEEYGTAIFEEAKLDQDELHNTQRILILACGTSWHAGCLGAYMLEDKARIPVQVEIASEFRYKNPLISPGTLVLVISQSGETADTLAAMKEVQAKGSKVLALCNVQGSTIAREADYCILLHAGPEIGVCSTKAFTSQVVTIALFMLMMARMRNMDKQEGQYFIEALKRLPHEVEIVLSQSAQIQRIAKKYAHYDSMFFVGRRYMYPTTLEGALKLKEISYINANGYAAGEMKHGPIALINEQCPTIALCANKATYEKTLSNLMEIKARNGKIIAIAEEGQEGLEEIVDEIIRVPSTLDELAAIPTTVVTQLLSYYIAKERGADIDMPRNLAKSVTVE
jgi:glutamine---fructose-6-phosphate transaminase (isomerizing)